MNAKRSAANVRTTFVVWCRQRHRHMPHVASVFGQVLRFSCYR